MWDHFLPRLEHLGLWTYWIVFLAALIEATAFVGLFFPGTTFVVFVGYLSSRHIIDVGDAMWFVALGGIIGDSISYYLGRKGKNYFKSGSRFFKPELLDKGKKFFERHGAVGVFFARFVGPLRPVVPFVAGLSHMDSKRFFLFNILGGIAAAVVYILIGYYFGYAWHTYRHALRHVEPLVLLALLAGTVWYLWHKKYLNGK